MGITNEQSGTRVDEVADGIYRISTPFPDLPGGFSFNQYLLEGGQSLLFHTGPRQTHALVRETVSSVIDLADLRFIGFSHYESDECGALNEFLAAAPNALPLCGEVNAMINGDCFDRPPHVLADGETLVLGQHSAATRDARLHARQHLAGRRGAVVDRIGRLARQLNLPATSRRGPA